ncbi:MAG: hypothetical protein M1815_006216 [Lichina confinis]|nr:MAG: hypothetical protein M1815_006216 [Lichina confinis]
MHPGAHALALIRSTDGALARGTTTTSIANLAVASKVFLATGLSLRYTHRRHAWGVLHPLSSTFGRSDVVVRDPARRGRVLTSDDSAMSLPKRQAIMSLLVEPPGHSPEILALHHFLFRVTGIAGFPRSPTLLAFYLCLRAEGKGFLLV